ncbi:hypothetical protein [Rhodoblastus sp.]|uniref:hypothetical protein n=1 Tax=Rhodoblastus sp. TaxID=1962975 RepID=UPI003F9BEC7C
MIRCRVAISLAATLAAMLAKIPLAQSREPDVYIQTNISAASIVEYNNRFVVEVTILASDIEQMFQKSGDERVGVDLSQPGEVEREIGKFVEKRVAMRNNNGSACASKVEQAGEDPKNDEGVLVVLSFECAGADAIYDVTKLLMTQGPRAWQVVTILRGDTKRQVMVNAENSSVGLSTAQ